MLENCIYNKKKEWNPKNNREIYLMLTQGFCGGEDLCNDSYCALNCNSCDYEYDDEEIKEIIKNSNNELFMKYTILHIKAFKEKEEEIYRETGIKLDCSKIHDLDKLFMYCFMEKEEAHNLHVKMNKHHLPITEDLDDEIMIEEIIDHDCARYTKPDKPKSALDMNKEFFNCSKYERLCYYLGLTERNTVAISEEEFYKMANKISDKELLEWVKKSFEFMSKIS